MRRLTVAFLMLVSAALLAACGDTGDHFLEFRKAPPGPTVVTAVALAMPIVAGPQTRGGTFKLYVTAYNNGAAVAAGTTLANPIVINTNWVGIKFTVNGKKVNTYAFGAAPGTITVTYTAPARPCAAPIPGITAFDKDASPQTVVLNFVQGCSGSPGPSPSPSTRPTRSPKPPTPTPSPIVKAMSLSMPSTPNPLSPGTPQLFVTAFGPTGAQLAAGTAFTSPIVLSSNDSCSISFSSTQTSGTQSGTTIQLNAAPNSPITVNYTPPSGSCPRPTNGILISASDVTASPQQVSFAILGGTTTVASMTITTPAVPDPASEGIYPLYITPKDSGGNTIPAGITLTNPISLSSNAACATTFGFTDNVFNPTLTMSTTQNQVFMKFLGNNNSCTTPPATVVVRGSTSDGITATYSFPF